ncbi:hypothetical protein B0H66DRAFT_629136 [Apodospora peruviana]|uniref:Uncharacterized protein n=1 Tax=Apodospora peruviana TaxID=516989 RepID=A0AAE0LZI9_9PEZI|nr:hypothetical protein B0H66DRAFT_629136 [Apodospora peruviana]
MNFLKCIGTPFAILILLLIAIITAVSLLLYTLQTGPCKSGALVQYNIYLDHFERLHPELIGYVAAALATTTQRNKIPHRVIHWPHKTKRNLKFSPFGSLGFTLQKDSTTFRPSVGLFAWLEDNWSRRVVWTFLRDQVEHAVAPGGGRLVTEKEKEAFGKVMEMMIRKDIMSPSQGPFSLLRRVRKMVKGEQLEKRQKEEEDELAVAEEKMAARYAYLGRLVVVVRKDNLDWILKRGALLLPSPSDETRFTTRYLARFPPVWRGSLKDGDLEKGLGDCWQVVDARSEVSLEEKRLVVASPEVQQIC